MDAISRDLVEAAILELEQENEEALPIHATDLESQLAIRHHSWLDGGSRSSKGSFDSADHTRVLHPIEKRIVADTYMVNWDGPDDPTNPYNWSVKRKWLNVIIISTQAMICPMISTILATCDTQIATEFGLNNVYAISLPVALFVLGLGIGPLYLAPYSELHGKRNVYVISYWMFTLVNIGGAFAPNMPVLATLRFLSGIAGSAGPSLGGSSLGDMFVASQRGKAQAIYTFTTSNGPLMGAILGGVLLHLLGDWRWLLRIMAILSCIAAISTSVGLKETYGPYILEQKAKRLRQETNDPSWFSRPPIRVRARLAQAFTRPIRLFLTVPICFVMTMYSSFIFGIYYLYLTTTPLLFNPTPVFGLFSYQWKQEYVGLAYLSGAIGGLTAVVVLTLTYGRSYRYMCQRYGGEKQEGRPEFRMPFLQVGMVITPIGLIVFAWTAQNQTHWIWPMMGNLLFCCGMMMCHTSIQTYVVDSFEKHSASALAAMVLVRSLVGCLFSMTGFQLFKNLNYGWGTMVLAFICIAALPLPTLLYFYGPQLRRNYVPR